DQALSIGYVRNLAGWLGMDPRDVQRAVASAARSGSSSSRPHSTSPDEVSAGSSSESDEPTITRLRTDTITRTERDVLMAVLQHPDLVGEQLVAKAARIRFTDPALAVVRDAVAVNL